MALKTRVSQIHWRTVRNAGTTERAREVRFDSLDVSITVMSLRERQEYYRGKARVE